MVFLAPRSNVILFDGYWKHEELKALYIGTCHDPSAADFAAEALRHYRITELRNDIHQTGRATALELVAMF